MQENVWEIVSLEENFHSHLIYYIHKDGILNDKNPDERKLGIGEGLAWASHADAKVVYTDRGISEGMKFGIEKAIESGRPVEYRTLNPTTSQEL